MRNVTDKKDKYVYVIEDLKKFKTKKIPNTHYDPEYKTPRKPKYCLSVPQYICLEKNCSHLAYTNAEKEDYLFLNKKLRSERKA